MLTITAPIRARLGIHATALMGMIVRHIRIHHVLRVRIWRGRRRDRRICRYFIARLVREVLIAPSVLLGQGRFLSMVWHTSAAHSADCWMAKDMKRANSAVLRSGDRRGGRWIADFLSDRIFSHS
jgi:hypothetical protein